MMMRMHHTFTFLPPVTILRSSCLFTAPKNLNAFESVRSSSFRSERGGNIRACFAHGISSQRRLFCRSFYVVAHFFPFLFHSLISLVGLKATHSHGGSAGSACTVAAASAVKVARGKTRQQQQHRRWRRQLRTR